MSYTAKNILVTGGAGFIGCRFIRHMLATHTNCNIINLDALTYAGSQDNLKDLPSPQRHHFVHGSIMDRELVDKLLTEHNIDSIVHFAAESHVDNSISGPAVFLETNIMGTFNLLEAAKKYWKEEYNLDPAKCKFHHISTDEVYGSLATQDPAFTENHSYQPNSPYSASKASSDHIVRAYMETYKLPATISNCSNNYGPNQHNEKLIPTIIRSCINNKPIPIYGSGENIRDWLYVDDHCRAIDMIMQTGAPGQTYNVGGDNEKTNIDLAKVICERMQIKMPQENSYTDLISHVEDRAGHDFRYAIDATKIKTDLNWHPSQDFSAMLDATLDFYIDKYKAN